MDFLIDLLQFLEHPRPRSTRVLLERVLEKGREMTGAEVATIYTFTRRGRQRYLEPAARLGEAGHKRVGSSLIPVGNGSAAGRVAATGETLFIDDVAAAPFIDDMAAPPPDVSSDAGNTGVRTLMCFPLTNYDDEVIAVLELANRRTATGRGPVPFPRSLAEQAAMFNRLAGRDLDRALMVERVSKQNRKLKARSGKLSEQRARISDLQAETEEAFQLSIKLLAQATNLHDKETGNHIVRVNEYSYFLSHCLGLPEEFCDEIRYSAQLHDVGKMSVDSAVLKKSGRLTPIEREEMNRHTVYGYKILSGNERLGMAAEIAYNHHEKWDGSGYPRGKRAEEIPLSARIVQMADVYDALRSARVYKSAMSHAETCRILSEGDDRIDPKGHFDPKLLQVFAANHAGMDEIWRRLAD